MNGSRGELEPLLLEAVLSEAMEQIRAMTAIVGRTVLILLLLAVVPARAARDGPNINIEIVNYFLVPDAYFILGMDYDPSGDRIFFCDNITNKVFVCRAADGHILETIDVTFREDPSIFGVCYDPTTGYMYVNDWGLEEFYRFDGAAWTPLDDPAGKESRGFDLGPGAEYFYETDYDRGFYKFAPGGETHYFEVSGFQSRTSGMTYFPYFGAEGVAIDTYEQTYINFFEIVGTDAVLIGTAEIPVYPIYYSLGLTYAQGRGTFFWSCWDENNVFWIYEFDIDFEFESVKPTSLGRLKASYR
ncbi:MAG: hypothetical protein JSW52_08340 [Candidatus Coatesbacteria bacterium]|nr:MAG: hypothetical protein JSW52_08340 [Candidatus Coatesbacteria bacterium]